MFSWNSRRYGYIWNYELQLHHFPGDLGLQQPAQLEAHHPTIRPIYAQHATEPTPNEINQSDWRLNFAKRTYILAGIFITISLIQWLLFAQLVPGQRIFVLPGFICLAMAFSSLLLLTFCLVPRGKVWFDCLFAWIFVEMVAMGVALLLPKRLVGHILLAVTVSVVCLVLCYVLGACLPQILLPGEIALGMTMILFFVAGTIVLTLYIVTDKSKYQAYYFVLIGIVTLFMGLYHAQIVHSRRFAVPVDEYLSCAIVIFVHFDLFFMSFYYTIWVHKVWS